MWATFFRSEKMLDGETYKEIFLDLTTVWANVFVLNQKSISYNRSSDSRYGNSVATLSRILFDSSAQEEVSKSLSSF